MVCVIAGSVSFAIPLSLRCGCVRVRALAVMGQKKSKEAEPPPADPNDFRGHLCYWYKQKVLPLEKYLDFDFFYGAYLDDAEFNARASVLLVGGYSVGKTSLIEFLIDQQYPGMRIGPEPTTDAFTVVMYDENVRMIPGTSLISESSFPYKSLEKYGAPFLSKLYGATCPAPLLKTLTLIDTPGILAGEKQSAGRGYDFESVISYLGDKVDVILLLFDPHKLDIPDEIKNVIVALQRNEEKIRIVLNKADSVGPAELNRVRGALMWGLGKAMKYRTEVPQVYAGSFWKKPLKQKEYRDIFEEDQKLLLNEMIQLTRTTDVRRLNDVAKRARMTRIHAFIVDELRDSLPICDVEKGKEKLINNLETVVLPKVVRKRRITFGDLPNVQFLTAKLKASAITQWPRLNPALLELVDQFLKTEFPRLYAILPPDAKTEKTTAGVLGQKVDVLSVEAEYAMEWKGVQMASEKSDWREKFQQLSKGRGYVHPSDAQDLFKDTGLPRLVLNDLWRQVDLDGDTRISENEFYLLCYLIDRKKQNKLVPPDLPSAMYPPETRASAKGGKSSKSQTGRPGSGKGKSKASAAGSGSIMGGSAVGGGSTSEKSTK